MKDYGEVVDYALTECPYCSIGNRAYLPSNLEPALGAVVGALLGGVPGAMAGAVAGAGAAVVKKKKRYVIEVKCMACRKKYKVQAARR